MKKILMLLILFGSFTGFSQSNDEAEAKKVVTDFFDAFHKQDSVALRTLAHPSIKMQSIGANAEGKVQVSTMPYGNFLKSIISIPSTTKFEEKLHSYNIQVNGPLAQVVTEYSFWMNEKLSHCGVNSFTLVKEDQNWKIVYLIDTRKKDGCTGKELEIKSVPFSKQN